MGTIRTAIIGVGVIGLLHAKTLAALGRDIVAICDVDGQTAACVRDQYAPGAELYTDWERMLDEVRPDAVHICTPHYLHADMIVGALRRDINVLCEKPLCISHEQIRRVIKAEKDSRAVLGVVHQNRFNPSNLYAKQYLEGKKIISAHASVVWHRDEKYYKSAEWRGKWSTEGGGVLINQALHTLDLLQWMSEMPESLSATCTSLTLGDVIEVEDTAVLTAFGDTPFTFFATNSAAVNMPVELTFKLEGGEIFSVFPDYVVEKGQTVTFPKEKGGGKSYYGSGHGKLFVEFYRCLEAGEKFPIDAGEGSKVIRLILAAYESRGHKITV